MGDSVSLANAYTRLNFTNVFAIVGALVDKCFQSEAGRSALSANDKQLIYYFKLHDRLVRNLTAFDAYMRFLKLFVKCKLNSIS